MEYMKPTSIKDKLTIVIPSYNEEGYIGRTITSIVKQTNIKGTRVIISDNHSTDRTRTFINNLSYVYKDMLNIELIDGGTVSVGRNNGAKLVKTKYILFVDSDTHFFNNDTIKDTLNEIESNDYDLLTCKIKSCGKDIRTMFIFFIFNIINRIISTKTPFSVGTYFLTKKDMFFVYGMFDETLNHSEDYLLSKKYKPNKFIISKHYIGQDDRRFKKMGYFGMIKMVIKGFFNRNNPDFYKKDVGYWN